MVAKKTTAASATTDAAETVETMVKAGQEAAQQSYEKAVSFTQENVDKAAKAFMGGYDEFATLGKGNYDAYVSSMNVLVKAFEEMGKEVFTFTQGSLENSVKVGNELMAAKTLNQVVDVQNTYAKSVFDAALAESTKLSEMSIKTANDAIAPIQERVNVTVEKMSKPVAA